MCRASETRGTPGGDPWRRRLALRAQVQQPGVTACDQFPSLLWRDAADTTGRSHRFASGVHVDRVSICAGALSRACLWCAGWDRDEVADLRPVVNGVDRPRHMVALLMLIRRAGG